MFEVASICILKYQILYVERDTCTNLIVLLQKMSIFHLNTPKSQVMWVTNLTNQYKYVSLAGNIWNN